MSRSTGRGLYFGSVESGTMIVSLLRRCTPWESSRSCCRPASERTSGPDRPRAWSHPQRNVIVWSFRDARVEQCRAVPDRAQDEDRSRLRRDVERVPSSSSMSQVLSFSTASSSRIATRPKVTADERDRRSSRRCVSTEACTELNSPRFWLVSSLAPAVTDEVSASRLCSCVRTNRSSCCCSATRTARRVKTAPRGTPSAPGRRRAR